MPPDDATAPEPDDIRSAINAAIADADPVAEPQTQADESLDDGKSQQPRDPSGKFLTKSELAEEAQSVAAEKPTETTAPAEKTDAKPAIDAPANWSAADKEMLKKLPADAQEFVTRRHAAMEADYTRKMQGISDFRREFEPIKSMFDPHADALKRSGYTPSTLIKAWMDVETKLQGGAGVDVVKDIVRGYNIDRQQVARALGLVVPSAAAGVDAPPPVAQPATQLPPEIAAKLQNFDQFIAQQQRQQQIAAETAQREAENRVMSTIDSFRNAKNTAGESLHPHYDEVEEHMTRLAIAARTSGAPVPSLDELYDQAVYANPSTRAKVLEAQRAAEKAQHDAAEQKRIKEARATAEKARRAGSSVTGAPGSGQSAATSAKGSGDSLRSALLAAVEEVEAA